LIPLSDPGYAIHGGVFSRDEMKSLAASLETADLPRSRAGARHALSCEFISRVAGDSRLVDLASHWLGKLAIPFKATLFEKSPEANWLVAWHQDTAGRRGSS
jgi:hypothetical protein